MTGWTDIGGDNGISGHTSVNTIYGGFFLTGERIKLSNNGWSLPTPRNYFNPRNKTWGAFMPCFSYTFTKTSEDLFKNDIMKGAEEVHTVVLGLTWLWTSMIRWHFNIMYIHANGGTGGIITGHYSDQNTIGEKYRTNEWMFGIRLKYTM